MAAQRDLVGIELNQRQVPLPVHRHNPCGEVGSFRLANGNRSVVLYYVLVGDDQAFLQ